MAEDTLSVDRRFQELTTHIRFTDDISFKLIGLVPLVSGAGIAAVFLKAEMKESALLYFLCLFAALVTLGLFCWELRNIRICKWLRDRAADLEKKSRGEGYTDGHFVNFPMSCLGKTEAEMFVYTATILAWLVLPGFLVLTSDSEVATDAYMTWIARGYSVLAVGIIFVAIVLMHRHFKETNMSQSEEAIKQEVRKQVLKLFTAEEKGSRAEAESVLAPDNLYLPIVRWNGQPDDHLENTLGKVANPNSAVKRHIDPKVVERVELYLDNRMAIARSLLPTTDSRDGSPKAVSYLNTHVFVKMGEEWRCVAWQVTKVG